MQWKKSIRNKQGFTLVEVLVAFSCVGISCLLLVPLASTLQRLQKPLYYNEDRIAIAQLRVLLVQSRALSIQEEALLFTYRKKEQRLVFDIFLQDVDSLQFQKRKECMYVIWTRNKHRQEALLACE